MATMNCMSQQIHQQIYQQSPHQAEIQYYVYQDLQNVVNLLYSMRAVVQHFKGQYQHPMVSVCQNKLILQLNISNGIHLDQIYQCQKSKNEEFLKQQREIAQNILESIMESMTEQDKELLKEQLQNLESYKNNCLGKEFQWVQYQQKQTDLPTQFNEQVIQKLINSMQFVDNQVTMNRQIIYDKSQIESEIRQKALQYEKYTQNLLNQNFSLSSQQSNQNFQHQGNDQNQIQNNQIQQNQQYYQDVNKIGLDRNQFNSNCQGQQHQNSTPQSESSNNQNLNNQQLIENQQEIYQLAQIIQFFTKNQYSQSDGWYINQILKNLETEFELLMQNIKNQYQLQYKSYLEFTLKQDYQQLKLWYILFAIFTVFFQFRQQNLQFSFQQNGVYPIQNFYLYFLDNYKSQSQSQYFSQYCYKQFSNWQQIPSFNNLNPSYLNDLYVSYKNLFHSIQ